MRIRPKHTGHILGVALAGAGLLMGFASRAAHAQNAAQHAALARLGRASAHAHPNDAPTSDVEATSVPLDQPGGLAFDTAGNLYIADTNNNVIREVNLAGVITTVAGNDEQGYGGDGGPATAALLDSPVGVAVDGSGNIYIGDTHNHRVREVMASSRNIVTLAGTGVAGFSGDGGATTAAMLNLPTAVAVDSTGNIYVADTNNHRIREISGATINTVAGDGEQFYSGDGGLATAAGLDSPDGVAVDAAINIYIGDTHNQRVRLVTHATGIITTLAGTGVKAFTADGGAGSAALARPQGVAVDASGNVYVSDSDNNRIRSINGGIVTTVAGNGAEGFSGDTGASTSASLDRPRAVDAMGTEVAFADTGNDQVRAVNAGTVNTVGGVPRSHTESLILGGALSSVYGTGTLTATFSNGGQSATGPVTFYDGEGASPATIGAVPLSTNAASISTSLLSAGTHYIVATYAGDANNAAITSGVYVYIVTPAPLTAAASAVNLLYGQAIPTLAGTLSGVLAQDAGKVSATFTTAATITSPPATYPIAVQLTGTSAGNYVVTLGAGSGSIVIAQAPTTIALVASSASTQAGSSVTLTATVVSITSGTPTGTVTFYNGTTPLNTTPVTLSGGSASLAAATLPVGAQSLTAVYSGNTDFLQSTSSPVTETILSPDFTLAASPSTRTVLPNQSVNYTLTLTPTSATFVDPVSLSASGLPDGVTASFSPSSIAAGAGVSTTTLTLTVSSVAQLPSDGGPFAGAAGSATLALLMLPWFFRGRARTAAASISRASRTLIALFALAVVGALTGCGAGGFFGQTTKNYSVTVTAVSGPNTHTTILTLTVQ